MIVFIAIMHYYSTALKVLPIIINGYSSNDYKLFRTNPAQSETQFKLNIYMSLLFKRSLVGRRMYHVYLQVTWKSIQGNQGSSGKLKICNPGIKTRYGKQTNTKKNYDTLNKSLFTLQLDTSERPTSSWWWP